MSKILLIEDDAIIRRAYQTILTQAGFEVSEAMDGMHGLEKAREVKPDLIVLDMMMPNMDGIEFLREFDLKSNPGTKVIVFSNSSVHEKIEEAMKLGATKYLVKATIPPKDIVRSVTETLAGK